jgi:hypothetical protein
MERVEAQLHVFLTSMVTTSFTIQQLYPYGQIPSVPTEEEAAWFAEFIWR